MPTSRGILTPADVLERRIRRKLGRHLLLLGFERETNGALRLASASKDHIRDLHRLQRMDRLRKNADFLQGRGEELLGWFASGAEVDPHAIAPSLELIRAGTWQSDLFRMASLLWSVPVSQGYGRRMRYLVWDTSNNRLLGLIALGDPPFNLAARDSVIGWTSQERAERLVHVMDAFIVGAVPPYSFLLGGKLVACLIRSREVVQAFSRRYHNSVGVISGESKRASLVAVTTSSALGRSSLYNRLSLDGVRYFSRIGFTGGWGHFHVPDDLFEDMRRYLTLRRHAYARGYEFGDGPNWRLRSIRATLDLMGYDPDLLRHGVNREVFISWLASNGGEILSGERRRPDYSTLRRVSDIGALARERWMEPRALRDESFRQWHPTELLPLLDWRLISRRPITTGSQASNLTGHG